MNRVVRRNVVTKRVRLVDDVSPKSYKADGKAISDGLSDLNRALNKTLDRSLLLKNSIKKCVNPTREYFESIEDMNRYDELLSTYNRIIAIDTESRSEEENLIVEEFENILTEEETDWHEELSDTEKYTEEHLTSIQQYVALVDTFYDATKQMVTLNLTTD